MNQLLTLTWDFLETLKGRSFGKYLQIPSRDFWTFDIHFQRKDMADFHNLIGELDLKALTDGILDEFGRAI